MTSAKPAYVPAGAERTDTEFMMFGTQALQIKVSTGDADGRLLVAEVIADAGFGPPRHLHHEQDEWFYVTKGTFLIEVGGEQFDAQPGDSIFAPRKVSHAWAPTVDSARLVFALQPAGPFEDFAREATAIGRLPTPQEASSMFEAYGMEITGPPLEVAKTSFEGV